MATAWPNGKRIAVTVAVMYEVWSEGKAPPYSVQTTSLRPDTVNLSGITWAGYGPKTGVYRIIRTLDRHGIKGTFAINVRAAELYPESVTRSCAPDTTYKDTFDFLYDNEPGAYLAFTPIATTVGVPP